MFDGTEKSKKRIEKALTAETGLRATNFALAGYEFAIETVKGKHIRVLI